MIIIPSQKTCTKCGETKPLAEYYANPTGKHGLMSWCRACTAVLGRKYRRSNRERILDTRAAQRRANPEIGRQRTARWRKANPGKVKAYGEQYHRRNAEAIKAKVARWQRDNPDRVAVSVAATGGARRAQKMKTPSPGITAKQWRDVLAASLGICAYCNEQRKLTLDHIEPLARGGVHEVENAAAACKSCNSAKGSTPLLLWLVKRAHIRQAAAA